MFVGFRFFFKKPDAAFPVNPVWFRQLRSGALWTGAAILYILNWEDIPLNLVGLILK